MDIYTEEFWEILLDIIALCLCGFVILCLRSGLKAQGKPWIRSFFGYRRVSRSDDKSFAKKKEKDSGNILRQGANRHFGNLSDILAQLVRQSEMAFAMISDTIKIEREILLELIDKRKINNDIDDHFTEKPDQVLSHLQKKYMGIQERPDLKNDRYGEVVKLADLGLSVNEIYEKVRIPKGEIELIIKLNRTGYVSPKKGKAKAQAIA